MFEGELGANAGLIGADATTFVRAVATPALCIELGAFRRNIASMQAAATGAGIALRPHMKGHKSSRIARAQIEAGAVGLCCATAKEAEVAATSGVADLLITTPIASPIVLTRLAELARQGTTIALVVDTPDAIALLHQAASGADATFGVFIDLNVGQNRTGVSSPNAVVELATLIAGSYALQLRGVQAYYGHLQHIPTLADRRQRVEEQWSRARTIIDALRNAGHPIDVVTGGGTGTAELDLASELFTEIQPGSYPFMDSQYLDVERRAITLEPALTVLSRVTSTAVDGQVAIDAGTKAIATDPARFRLAAPALAGATHKFMGDEHSALIIPADTARPIVGDLVSLVATHCDPTVNLHSRYHVMDHGRLVDIWPIEARGY